MVTVSGKYGIPAAIILLASQLNIGCSTLVPARGQGGAPADAGMTAATAGSGATMDVAPEPGNETPVITREPLVVSSRGVALPQQAYDASGGKQPYKPQPNPYTGDSRPVPAEARAMFVSATARMKQGDLKAAKQKFEKITEKYPDLSGPWVRLGDIAQGEKKYDEAVRHYRMAVARNRNNVNAYASLGVAQRRQGDFNAAQETYLEALRIWKDFPEAHLNLAILYDLYANEPEAAQKHYEAYHFLTGRSNEDAGKWLVEVRQRTGIEQSFIDNPPGRVALEPIPRADDSSIAQGPGESAQSGETGK